MAAANTEILANYREQKKSLEKLAATARKQMQARLTELLVEAASIHVDYRNDFGEIPELPGTVKTFTVTDGKKKPEAPTTDAVVTGKKIGGLRRSLNAAIKNGDTARANELATQIKELGGTVDLDNDNAGAGEPAAELTAEAVPQVDRGADEVEGIEAEQPPAAAAGVETAEEAWI